MTIERWAIVEIMGHHRIAGRISQVEEFGAVLLRVEVPDPDGGFSTEDYGGSAIYRLRHCSEEMAREAQLQIGDPRPVMPARWRPDPKAPAIEHRGASSFEDDTEEHELPRW